MWEKKIKYKCAESQIADSAMQSRIVPGRANTRQNEMIPENVLAPISRQAIENHLARFCSARENPEEIRRCAEANCASCRSERSLEFHEESRRVIVHHDKRMKQRRKDTMRQGRTERDAKGRKERAGSRWHSSEGSSIDKARPLLA